MVVYQDRNNKNEYLWKIGDRRVDRIAREYSNLGFLVITNKANHKGVDIILISTPRGEIVKVIESTNYGYTKKGKIENISIDKLQRYYDSLNYFDRIDGIQKEIIVSHEKNIPETWYPKFREAKISIVVVGHQE